MHVYGVGWSLEFCLQDTRVDLTTGKMRGRLLCASRVYERRGLQCVLLVLRYLDYWNERVDEAVADIEETEEFENAYKKQEQRLFPFRTSSTEWTINGALGALSQRPTGSWC